MRWTAAFVLVVAIGMGAGSARAEDDVEAAVPPRGQVSIKATGKRVRVITVTPAPEQRVVVQVVEPPAAPAVAGAAPVSAPASVVVPSPAAPVAAPAAGRQPGGTNEYSERSVRLPGAYDPLESRYAPDARVNYPAPPPPNAYDRGYAYGGYGYSPRFYGDGCSYGSGYGYGYGYRSGYCSPNYGFRSFGSSYGYGRSYGYGSGSRAGFSYTPGAGASRQWNR